MEVTHKADHVTHAVIGGAKAIDFGISDSAEFFNILSSTLYSNQILAVVRETLCNAWDAHVEAGITDKPIQITLSHGTFAIRDFGHGIPHDKIGPIYAVYGASTKKHDGKQTGGFGLGCKAPFAYVDHFEVQSFNKGVRTIYNMSKSSAEVEGKPGIITIGNFTTEETGLAVSMAIQKEDWHKFETYIRRIVANGGMHAELNGMLLKVLPFDKMTQDFLISEYDFMGDGNKYQTLLLRYGNVIYPLPNNDDYAGQVKEISAFLAHMGKTRFHGQNKVFRIVFQAAPHSISVLPSREGLSMQKSTVAGITEILDAFIERITKKMPEACWQLTSEGNLEAQKRGKKDHFFNLPERIHGISDQYRMDGNIGVEITALARQYASREYPSKMTGFRERDVAQRLKILGESGWLDRGLFRSFMTTNRRLRHRKGVDSIYSNWAHRKIFAPVVKLAMQFPGLDLARLTVNNHQSHERDMFGSGVNGSVELLKAKELKHIHYLSHARRVFVLRYKAEGSIDRLCRAPRFAKDKEGVGAFVSYDLPRSVKAAEIGRQLLEQLKVKGWDVYDLTQRQKWEELDHYQTLEEENAERTQKRREAVKERLEKMEKVAKVTGYARIDTAITDKGNLSMNRLVYGEGQKQTGRIEEPEWWIHIPSVKARDNLCFDNFTPDRTERIIRLFGSKGAMTLFKRQEEILTKKGVLELKRYVSLKLCEEIMASPTIREYWAFERERVIEYVQDREGLDMRTRTVSELIYEFPELMAKFGVLDNRTERDHQLLDLYNDWFWHTTPDLEAHEKCENYLDSIKIKAAGPKLLKMCEGNILLSMMDIKKVSAYLDLPKDSAEHQKAMSLLIQALRSGTKETP